MTPSEGKAFVVVEVREARNRSHTNADTYLFEIQKVKEAFQHLSKGEVRCILRHDRESAFPEKGCF